MTAAKSQRIFTEHYGLSPSCKSLADRSTHLDRLRKRVYAVYIIKTTYISISIYFVQNQVILHSQNTNEQDNQAHNMLSQLPAVKDRKVKQQYN